MPQATKQLQERWHCDSYALKQLGANFKLNRGGVISPKKGYTPTDDDLSAVEYLVFEWDYGYEALPSFPINSPVGRKED